MQEKTKKICCLNLEKRNEKSLKIKNLKLKIFKNKRIK